MRTGFSRWRGASALRARRARPPGPRCGGRRARAPARRPGARSASQRPSGVGLDVAGAGDRGAAERGQVDRLGVDRPGPSRRARREVHHALPGAGALRRIRRRGRSTSIASSDAWTRDELRGDLAGGAPRCRAGPGRRRPRTARCAWATSSSSCWLLRTFSERNRSKNSHEVVDGRVAEDLGRAVLVGAGDPLGQVGDQPGELVEERLLGELDRLLEPGRDPLLLLLVEAGRECDQVVGRLDAGEVPGDAEEADAASRGSRPG